MVIITKITEGRAWGLDGCGENEHEICFLWEIFFLLRSRKNHGKDKITPREGNNGAEAVVCGDNPPSDPAFMALLPSLSCLPPPADSSWGRLQITAAVQLFGKPQPKTDSVVNLSAERWVLSLRVTWAQPGREPLSGSLRICALWASFGLWGCVVNEDGLGVLHSTSFRPQLRALSYLLRASFSRWLCPPLHQRSTQLVARYAVRMDFNQ